MKKKYLTKEEITEFFEILSNNITPITELNYSNNLELIIAVVLSAQSTDKMVNRATDIMFAELKTLDDYINAGQEKITEYIKIIGLYRTKGKNIFLLCKKIKEDYNGKVPNSLKELLTLAGVGRKTANVVLNVAFNKPTLAVDTHIFRVANRCGFVSTPSAEKTELPLIKKIPKKYLKDAHNYLVLHGRYTCKAIKPMCNSCKVSHVCKFKQKTLPPS